MIPLVPPHVSAELIAELDAQISILQCCAIHVIPGPCLVGISWNRAGPIRLDHPELDSFLQAELIAQRVNALQSTTDLARSQIVAGWEVTAWKV